MGDFDDLLNTMMPEVIEDNLNIVVQEDDQASEINLGKVLQVLEHAEDEPVKVQVFLLKVKQGICNLAYQAEEFHARLEDSFRVWRADLNRQLNYKDERNPLVKSESKTTNAAIKAYLRDQPEYEEFKNKIAQSDRFKGILWTAKKTVESAIEVVNIFAGGREVEFDEVDLEEMEGRIEEIADGLLSTD